MQNVMFFIWFWKNPPVFGPMRMAIVAQNILINLVI